MKITFLNIALQELNDAYDFYELAQNGLGKKFKEEIRKSLIFVQKNPWSCPSEKKSTRRFILFRFPYKILYSIDNEAIIVLAIAHHHRKPDYWAGRPGRL